MMPYSDGIRWLHSASDKLQIGSMPSGDPSETNRASENQGAVLESKMDAQGY